MRFMFKRWLKKDDPLDVDATVEGVYQELWEVLGKRAKGSAAREFPNLYALYLSLAFRVKKKPRHLRQVSKL